MSTGDNLVIINCKAKGNPPPHYRYGLWSTVRSEIVSLLFSNRRAILRKAKIFDDFKRHTLLFLTHRWKVNGEDIDTHSDSNYRLLEGNLLISNPDFISHGGVYQCIATNVFGTIVSRDARVQFACKSMTESSATLTNFCVLCQDLYLRCCQLAGNIKTSWNSTVSWLNLPDYDKALVAFWRLHSDLGMT